MESCFGRLSVKSTIVSSNRYGFTGGAEAKEIALACNLKVSPPPKLAGTLLEILKVLFGTEFRGEVLELSEERSVLLIKLCPFLMRCRELGESPSVVFHPCMAFSISAIESLNKEFSLRFIRGMCMGDKNCEIRIARRESLERDDTQANRNEK
jgi:hypothetical protein